MIDLKDLTPKSETVVVELLNPVDLQPLGASIELYAPHTAEYKQVVYEQQNKRLKKMREKKNPNDLELDVAEMEYDAIDLMARTTKSWDIKYGGVKPKLTVEKAREIYNDVFWIRNQVEAAWADTVNFTKS
jgi:IS4 transposase